MPDDVLQLDARGMFGKKGSAKVGKHTVLLAAENDQAGQPMGEVEGLCFHWSAGRRITAWDGYHGGVAASPDGLVPIVVQCLGWNQKGKHLWGRNGSYWGMSLFGCKDMGWAGDRRITWPGPEAPTPEMLEALAVYAAEVCAWKNLDPRGSHEAPHLVRQGERLVPSGRTIRMPNLSDHKDWAEKDGYASDRGDIGAYKAPLFARIVALYTELKANKRQFRHQALLK